MMSSKTELQFNERTFEAYGQEGLDPPRGILAVKARYEKFKPKFKQDKGPLQIIIKSMHRRPKIIFEKDLNLSDEHTRNVNNIVIILRQSITIVNIIL